MLKVAICDDSQGYIDYLEKLLRQMAIENIELSEYTSGQALLEDSDKMHDVIILDICLGDARGNEIAEKIRKVNRSAVLTLCSGLVQPTDQALEVDAYRYLLKNDPDDKIRRVLRETFEEAERRFEKEYLLARMKKDQVRVRISDILYISKIKYGSEFHMAVEEPYFAGEQLTTKRLLQDLYEQLKDNGFEYANSSYIVNYRWVGRLEKDHVRFSNGTSLPVSRNSRKRFEERWADTLIGKYPNL